MTTFARTIPRILISVWALTALAARASATITYTSCSSGCSSTSGTYTIWQTAAGSAGLTFSMSPTTFASSNLASGVYTDGSGTVLTGYNGASIDTLMSVSGSSLLEGNNGTGTGIQIQLPANTYAFAMEITTPSGSGFTNPLVELGDHNVSNANYSIIIASAGSVQFFGIISSTPLPTLFIGPLGNGRAWKSTILRSANLLPPLRTSSVALIGSGLVILGLLRRRRIHEPDRPVVKKECGGIEEGESSAAP